MNEKRYLSIKSHYESCLEKHGDTYLGVDWPRRESAQTIYRVMLEVIKNDNRRNVTLLDFGCGASHLYEYMLLHRISNVQYSGLDISEKFIDLSQRKFPSSTYYCLDILETPEVLPSFDYIIINGVFTERLDLSFDEMLTFFENMLITLFQKVRIALAVNVMSKQVEWERDDLFHLPMDVLAAFIVKNLSRNFIIRHDYGLFQYTAYVYKQAPECASPLIEQVEP
jgi:cyclopropane fatty-acyl-phospholipid synthase-like methyltransferase